VQLILFYGQRRVGKTSILKFIPQNIAAAIEDEFIFISFDFQAQESSPLENILHGMAKKILGDLLIHEKFLDSLADDIISDTNVFSSQFLPTIYDRLGSKKLVFLCDEFDVLSEPNARHIIQLRELHEGLFIIPVVGRHISRLPKLRQLLREPLRYKIGFLDKEHSKNIQNIKHESLKIIRPNY
jgi:hypothetical protein